MGPNATLLLAAIVIVLVVMAAAFCLAGRRESRETYRRSWCLANLLISGAIVVFIFERSVPPLLLAPPTRLPIARVESLLGLPWRRPAKSDQRSVQHVFDGAHHL